MQPPESTRHFVVVRSDPRNDLNFAVLADMLQQVRLKLRMEVAFVSQIDQGRRTFRMVDQEGGFDGVRVGASDPVEEGFCQKVADGRLPKAIGDAMTHPGTRDMPATRALHIGAHLSVPIVLPDGTVYGTVCCFSRVGQPSLGDADVAVLQVLADLVADGVAENAMFLLEPGYA